MCMRLILSCTNYARALTLEGAIAQFLVVYSLAQSQVRAPVEANYARRRRGRHRVKSLCKNFVHILVIKYNVMTA